MTTCKVTFQPDGLSTRVVPGTTLMAATETVGIVLNTICGGAGTCGKCLVEVSGESQPVRACQYQVDRDLVVTVPDTSRYFEQKILREGADHGLAVEPLVCKHHVKLDPPHLGDLRSDACRLVDAINEQNKGLVHTCRDHAGTATAGTAVSWAVLRQLPGLFREHNYDVTAVCHSGRVFALEPGDTTGVLYGVAVDIGTTTVVANLVNLRTGKVVDVAAGTNPQVAYGDDVISRIESTRSQEGGLERLQRRIVDGINQLIGDLCKKSLITPYQIYELVAAGNATMQHLFLGIPVEQIAQAPYVAAFASAVNLPPVVLGINIHPEGNVYVMPSVAAHVGGDTVAVVLSTAMYDSEKVNLAIDIGTNGEIALGNREGLVTCSTAAGPAFEGARISCGMRGAAGAIERVYIRDDVELTVIGDTAPVGICGSGLVDALAELLNAGILDTSGRLLGPEECPDSVSKGLRQRLVRREDKLEFVLAEAEATKHGKPIVLTQRDIREAQLGKAAISAGVTLLLQQRGVTLDQIDNLYLAGAFGNYIRSESARRIGLLPPLDTRKIIFVGNAASAGARQSLISAPARRVAEDIARRMTYVELAGQVAFQTVFSESMFFPDV